MQRDCATELKIFMKESNDNSQLFREAILFDCLEAYNLTFGIVGESSELLVKIYNFIESSLENPELDASSFSLAVSAYS